MAARTAGIDINEEIVIVTLRILYVYDKRSRWQNNESLNLNGLTILYSAS